MTSTRTGPAHFRAALSRVLVYEGGWSDHPKDPGGKTMRGVTQRVYDGFRRNHGLPLQSVRLITVAELETIYRRQYAEKVRFSELPAGVDIVMLDGAVNSGPAQATKWLQRALGVQADGVLGEATLAAVRAHPDHDRLVADVIARRRLFLEHLKTWPTFRRGWTVRLGGMQAIGQAWATGSVGPDPVYAPGAEARAPVSDARKPPANAPADAATGGGVAGAVVAQTTEALTPLADMLPLVAKVVAVLTAVGALLVIAGLVWRTVNARRERARADALDLAPMPIAAEPITPAVEAAS